MPATPELWRSEQDISNVRISKRTQADITQLDDGSFIVAWDDIGPFVRDFRVQRFDIQGNAVGSPTRLFGATVPNEIITPDIAPNGTNFLLANIFLGRDESKVGVYEFDENGTELGFAEIDVIAKQSGGQRDQHLEIISSDVALVTWIEDLGEGDANVWQSRYDISARTASDPVRLLSTDTMTEIDTAPIPDGGMILAAGFENDGGSGVGIMIFNDAGFIETDFMIVSETLGANVEKVGIAVTALADGNHIVTYSERDSSDTDAYFVIVDNDGNIISEETPITSYRTIDNDDENIDIVALRDGGFIVVWEDNRPDTEGLKMQRFDAQGEIVGEVIVIDMGVDTTFRPRVIEAADGRIVTLYNDQDFDPSATALGNLRLTIWDPRDAPNTEGADVVGTIGADTIIESGPTRNVYAWDGDDVVENVNGLSDRDAVYDGGEGVDEFRVDVDLSAQVTIDLEDGSFTGLLPVLGGTELVGFENISGGAGNDILIGDGGANVILGNGGNDRIRGGDGLDTLDGGDGQDTLDYTDMSTRVVVRLNTQTVSTGDTISNFENASTGSANDALIGSDLGNILSAGDGNDYVDGLAGDDFILGGAGDDRIRGGQGNDIMDGGLGVDTLLFSDMSTRVVVRLFRDEVSTGDRISNFENVTTGSGDDALIGSSLANVLNAGAGDDYLDGLGGNDLLIGGAGNDRLRGGDGNDTLVGGSGMDDIDGGAGLDLVSFSDFGARIVVRLFRDEVSTGDTIANIEHVVTGSGNDAVIGSAVGNILNGGAGNDYLDGLGGRDVLVGGTGNDRLRGGDGADVFRVGQDADTVLDFVIGQDSIDLRDLGTSFDSYADLAALGSQDGADAVFDFGGGDTLRISNVQLSDLSAGDFGLPAGGVMAAPPKAEQPTVSEVQPDLDMIEATALFDGMFWTLVEDALV